MTAVGAGHVHDQPEFSSRVVHILALELFQLGLREGKLKTGRGTHFLTQKIKSCCKIFPGSRYIFQEYLFNHLICPSKSFVGIDGAIESSRKGNHPPAHLIFKLTMSKTFTSPECQLLARSIIMFSTNRFQEKPA